jgi:hypothetical protein
MRIVPIVLAMGGALLLAAFTAARPSTSPPKLKVGTYDSRAVAVAFAASKHNPVAAKKAEHDEAKEAGDAAKLAELERWGRSLQRRLHRQGFARVPVDDLLEHVEARLPEAAAKAGVDVIAFGCDYASDAVEVVDVTRELVALFDPSPKTLETVAQLAKVPPVDLDDIRD